MFFFIYERRKRQREELHVLVRSYSCNGRKIFTYNSNGSTWGQAWIVYEIFCKYIRLEMSCTKAINSTHNVGSALSFVLSHFLRVSLTLLNLAFLHSPVYLSSVKCASRSTTYSMNISRAVREFIVHTNNKCGEYYVLYIKYIVPHTIFMFTIVSRLFHKVFSVRQQLETIEYAINI